MDFVPGTRTVVEAMIRHGELEVAAMLQDLAASAESIVPHLVGLSVGHTRSGTVYTLAASSIGAASIDSTQYVDGRPCVDASTTGDLATWELRGAVDPLDEQRWASYARASAAAGVASSLSMPLMLHGSVVGGVNLYASTVNAFDGHHDELADALGADAASAVANADLSFHTCVAAQETADHLAEQDLVNQATGVIAARNRVDMTAARDHLANAAHRAGVTEVQAATTLIDALPT